MLHYKQNSKNFMIWSKQRFQHSFELLPRVFKEVAPLLLPISIGCWLFGSYTLGLIQDHLQDPRPESMVSAMLASLFGILFQGLTSIVWILYVARSTQRQAKNAQGSHPIFFLKEHFHQTLIEYIRAITSYSLYLLIPFIALAVLSFVIHLIYPFFPSKEQLAISIIEKNIKPQYLLLGSLLVFVLIIPGVVRYVQMIFVCLVASFDQDYLDGKKDALKESCRLVHGKFKALFFLTLLMVLTAFIGMNLPAKNLFIILFVQPALWCFYLYLCIYFSLTFFARASFKMRGN